MLNYDDENKNNYEYEEEPSSYSRSVKERADFIRRQEEEQKEERKRRAEEEQEEEKRNQKEKNRQRRERKRKRFLRRNRKKLIGLLVALGVLLVLFLIGVVLYFTHEVTTIEVSGNTLLSDEDVIEKTLVGPMGLGRNSIYLSYKYHDKEVKDIPFVEKMTVEVLSPTSIKITVYEKALAGYVNYLGDNMYFTRDGTVVEASEEKVPGIPEVTGLSFDHILLGQKLPVENMDIFDQILDITQLLEKYDLTIDRIYFDSDDNLTLFSNDVRIDLGQDEYTEEKIATLSHILPKLEGRSGTIDMTAYTPDQENVSFRESGIGALENITGNQEYTRQGETDEESSAKEETSVSSGSAETKTLDEAPAADTPATENTEADTAVDNTEEIESIESNTADGDAVSTENVEKVENVEN